MSHVKRMTIDDRPKDIAERKKSVPQKTHGQTMFKMNSIPHLR